MTASMVAGSDQAIALCHPGQRLPHCRLILVATILAASLAFLDGAVVNIALPSIGVELKGTGTQLQWLVTGYLLPMSALQLIAGALGDHYGRRRLLLIGIVLFTAASVLCAIAVSIEILLAARILQGVGAALLLPNSLAVLGVSFDGAGRGKAVATWTAAGAIASAFGPPLAGWLIDTASWRWAFWLNVPVGLAAIAVTVSRVPESSNGMLPLDLPGTTVTTAGLLCLTWAATQGSSRGISWSSGAMFVGAAMLFWMLVRIERHRGQQAMLPLRMFTSALFVGLNLFTFLTYAAFGALFVLLPFVLMTAADYSAAAAGAAILPLPIVLGLASSRAAEFADKFGARLALGIGAALAAVGYGLLLNLGDGAYWLRVFPALLVIAAGMTLLVAPLTSAVLSSVDVGHSATAAGFNSAVSRAGSLIAIAASGSVMAGQAHSVLAAFCGAAAVGAALCVIAAITAFLTLGKVAR
jgi:EmrB/QacA subfamily drug resistance transporter